MAGPIIVGRSFLAGATPEIIESLAAFAARFSVPTAILGALLIPTRNSGGVNEGTLPDAPDISYRKDGPEGTLRLATKAEDGPDVVVVAKNQGGLYVDVSTGQPIGRDLGSQLYLDFDAVDAGDLVDGDMQAGDLVEAKGTVEFLLSGEMGQKPIDDFLDQATKELRTADARGVGLKYYFVESGAADLARKLFGQDQQLQRIVVGYMPPRGRR